MQPCANWLRSQLNDIPDISDEEMNAAGKRPAEDLYTRLDEVNSLIIHHSATTTGNARVFRAMHRAVNGWVDIGYHFVIGNGTLSLDGEIEPGRPVWAVGAHAREHNSDSIGICLVGNFCRTSPTPKQLVSLKNLLRKLLEDYSLSTSGIMLHRDVPGCRTECPGDNITLKEVIDALS